MFREIRITKKSIVIESIGYRIKLPIENLVTKGSKIVGIQMPSGVILPISLLLSNNIKISVDPRLPYHI